MQVGFVGLGIMGFPMACHLLGAGHRLIISSRSARAAEMTAMGAIAYDSLQEIARRAQVVILMLPDTPEVENALFGADALADSMPAGTLLIDTSSISPFATRTFAARLAERNVSYVDAPVSGGELGAKAAALTIMAGGSPESFERARPLLQAMGKSIHHIGPNGDGQLAKIANQMMVALNIAAVGEALLFVSKAGADAGKVREALLGGFAGSRVLEVHGERMLKRSFNPGFRIKLHRKDLSLALAGGNELRLPLPQTALCQQLLQAADADESELDHSALVRILERLANHSIG